MSADRHDNPTPDQSPLDTGHDYDGIREHDNVLPNWWLATLFLTMAFGLGYWLYYHVSGAGLLPRGEYAAELDAAAQRARAAAAGRGEPDDALLKTLAASEQTTAAGRRTFEQSCVACHGAQGQGVVGPNLTDSSWIHGARPVEIRRTVAAGVTSKGMPAWETVLGAERVDEVVAYVLTLKGRNVPGKPPEGSVVAP